jgi:hypothetical protein
MAISFVDFYLDYELLFCWGDVYVGGGVIPIIYTLQYTLGRTT